jgi:hypothetical protein
MALAFLRAVAEMVAFLEDNTVLAFRAYPYHPDYLATPERSNVAGRVLEFCSSRINLANLKKLSRKEILRVSHATSRSGIGLPDPGRRTSCRRGARYSCLLIMVGSQWGQRQRKAKKTPI